MSQKILARALSSLLTCWLLCGAIPSYAQVYDQDTLEVVNWNLEYFGNTTAELPEEMRKTRTIMDSLNADVYALEEVVDIDSLTSLVQSLNGNYSYVVSPYGSFAPYPYGSQYVSAQKLAFIYRTSMVKNVTTRALLKNSLFASDYWSSGRLPFLVTADVLGRDNQWRQFNFIVIHAKAMSDYNSCNRRYGGYLELKDSLDTYFSNSRIIMLGDFNDDADESICSSFSESTFAPFVKDSTGDNFYKTVTLPLSRAGVSSIAGYGSFLDHVIISDEVDPYYVPGSAEMLKDKVNSWVSSYTQYVSDHYPVLTKYFIDHATSVAEADGSTTSLKVFPNPASDFVRISDNEKRFQYYELIDAAERKVATGRLDNSGNSISVQNLSDGIYFIRLTGNNSAAVKQIFVSR